MLSHRVTLDCAVSLDLCNLDSDMGTMKRRVVTGTLQSLTNLLQIFVACGYDHGMYTYLLLS